MDQEIVPLVDTINISKSLDSDLENMKNIDQVEEASNDVLSEEGSNQFVDTNDENVNIQQTEEASNQDEESSKPVKEDEAAKDLADRPCQFALSRIKAIMKMDPEMCLSSKESVFLVAKAAELFTEFLSRETYKFTSQGTRKTIQKKDIDQAINAVDSLCFLDAALD